MSMIAIAMRSVINPVAVTSFVTSFSNSSLRNNFTGSVGYLILVGSNPLIVTQLGRIFVTGNAGTHTVKLVVQGTGADVPGGSVSISMTGGTNNQFKYVSLASPVTLAASTQYYIVSHETNAGDQWYDNTPGTVSHTAVAGLSNAVFSSTDAAPWTNFGTTNQGYVPLDFKYHL